MLASCTNSPLLLKSTSLVRVLRYFKLYADNIDFIVAANERRLHDLLAIINGGDEAAKPAAAVELQDCIYKRAFLCRRRAEVKERQDQGREAMANWNGKCQAFTSEQSLDRILATSLPLDLVRKLPRARANVF